MQMRARNIWLLSTICCLLSTGCRREAVSLSVSLPVLSYMQSQPGGLSGGAVIDFPLLEIFDHQGRLVYADHNGRRNAAVLASLPNGIGEAAGASETLARTLAVFPLAKRDRARVLDNRRITVLSLSLEDCKACILQEEALNPERTKTLIAAGINVVAVRLIRDDAQATERPTN